MKRPALLFIPLFFCSCTQQPESSDIEITPEPQIDFDLPDSTIDAEARQQIAFEEYVNQIPILPVGHTKSCVGDLEIVELNDNTYKPEGAQVMGRMQSIDGTHFIIYAYPADIQLPVLEVYTEFGEKIHEQPLLELGICASTDPSTDGTSEFTILNATTIEIKNVYIHPEYNSSAKIDTIHLEELTGFN